ncbi:MAG: hypothetical protein QM820_62020 [Minicystis sp.]
MRQNEGNPPRADLGAPRAIPIPRASKSARDNTKAILRASKSARDKTKVAPRDPDSDRRALKSARDKPKVAPAIRTRRAAR